MVEITEELVRDWREECVVPCGIAWPVECKEGNCGECLRLINDAMSVNSSYSG
jgi:uncharacterized protein YbdZ (MbtH family)